MKTVTLALFLVAFGATSTSWSARPPMVKIVGLVEKIKESVVTIKTMSGSVKVPRNSLNVSSKKVHSGATVVASVQPETLIKLNQ